MPLNKPELRHTARQARADISPAHAWRASHAIAKRVVQLPKVIAARSVFCYVGVGHEVNTEGLIQALLAAGKTVATPWVGKDDVMRALVVHAIDELVPGRWGVPATRELDELPQSPDVTICPGLAFTREGHRLGQGGGHYDRFLMRHPDTFTIGLCFEAQIMKALPIEAHDQVMDCVVTEAGCYAHPR